MENNSDETFSLSFAETLELITEIEECLLEIENLETTLYKIVEKISTTFSAQTGYITLADKDKEKLSIAALYGAEDWNHKSKLQNYPPRKAGWGITGRAFREEEIFIRDDIQLSSDLDENFEKFIKKTDINTIITLPLIYQSECTGVLTLYFSRKLNFPDEYKKILKLLGKQVGNALHLSRLIRGLKKANKKLEKLATHDGLTGLPNHRSIQLVLRKQLEEAHRYNQDLAIIMADIDHFKKINDTYGHPVGDRVLSALAEIFREQIRGADAVGRYGGEEFLFILPETMPAAAKELAERIRTEVEKATLKENGDTIDFTISMGLAGYKPGKEDLSPTELLEKADEALYRAKEAGRNRCVRLKD